MICEFLFRPLSLVVIFNLIPLGGLRDYYYISTGVTPDKIIPLFTVIIKRGVKLPLKPSPNFQTGHKFHPNVYY